MRRGAVFAVALASLAWSGLAGAQVPDAPSPVVTVTQDRLFSGTLYGQAVQARADAASQALQAENRRIEAELAAEEKALTERRATVPPAEFRPLADAFDTKVEGIRAAQEAKARDLIRRNEDEKKRFFDTAIPVLAQLMTEMGAVAILDKAAIVLSFDRIDITDQAIARIDAVLGDGSSSPPPASGP